MKAKRFLSAVLSICLAVLTLFSFASCGEDFVELKRWFFTSGLLNNIIIIDWNDEEVICKFAAEKGTFLTDGYSDFVEEVEVLCNQEVSWRDWNEEGERIAEDYVSVLLCKKSKVIGYAVVNVMEKDYHGAEYQAKTVKQKIFRSPKSESETKKTIKSIIERDKGRWI